VLSAELPSLSGKVRRAAIWNMGSTMLIKLSSIAITAIVARVLNQHDFGVFAIANTVFIIVQALGEFGVSSCLMRADFKVSDLAPTLWTVSLVTCCSIAVSLVVFARPIAIALGSSDATGPIRVMAIVMVLTGVAAVPTSLCLRDLKQETFFLANAVGFFPSTFVLLVLAKSGNGAMAFAWSRVVGQAVATVIILWSAPKIYRLGMSRSALRVLYQFGIPLALANFTGYLLQNVDYALIGRLMGPVMLGTYVLAFNAASWSSSLLGSALTTVAIPAFSRVTHDSERLVQAMVGGVRAVILIAAPMGAIEMALARPLVLVLYGARWEAAAKPLAILTLYGFISICCILFAQMLAALGKSRFVFLVQIVWLAALIPTMAIGVHTHGIVGAAGAHIFVIVPIVLPCYLLALKRATDVRINLLVRAAVPALAAAVIAGAIAWLATRSLHSPLAQLVVGGGLGGLFYLTVTAPQLIMVIGRGQIHHPAVLKLLRTYYLVGRSLGMRVGPPPRHARRRGRTVVTWGD
jgi:lipopolysaccharide exporter